jgi:CRP/FNR family transcriptional regulator, cyclic AMP receptor protein
MARDGFDFEGLVRAGYPVQRFGPGERVFTVDDEGSVMYAVRTGSVSITSAGEVLETVRPGETFGELSLIDGSARAATAIAREDTELAVIDERAFNYLIERNPAFALDLLRRLSRRLRRSTEGL